MKINYHGLNIDNSHLEEHYKWLIRFEWSDDPTAVRQPSMAFTDRAPPIGFEKYHCVDVLGSELVWMNEAFPKEKFTWYNWFESVFLVPDEMYSFLLLRWA